jgi:hypothetical protein
MILPRRIVVPVSFIIIHRGQSKTKRAIMPNLNTEFPFRTPSILGVSYQRGNQTRVVVVIPPNTKVINNHPAEIFKFLPRDTAVSGLVRPPREFRSSPPFTLPGSSLSDPLDWSPLFPLPAPWPTGRPGCCSLLAPPMVPPEVPAPPEFGRPGGCTGNASDDGLEFRDGAPGESIGPAPVAGLWLFAD